MGGSDGWRWWNVAASGGAGGEGGGAGMDGNETGGAVEAIYQRIALSAGQEGPGKQIEDFPLEMWNGDRFDFHNCGGGTRPSGFLNAGWCGACDLCAHRSEFYTQYRDQGLEVVWIVSEDQNRMPPSRYMEQRKEAKMADFTIIRDNGFFQTGRFIDPNAAGNILPRQYVLATRDGLRRGRPFARGEAR